MEQPHIELFKLRPKVGIHKIGPGVVMEMLEPHKPKKGGKMTADDFLGNEVNINQGWAEEMAFIEVDWRSDFIPAMSIRIKNQYFMIHQKPGVHGIWYCSNSTKHENTAGVVTYDRWGSQDGLTDGETCIDRTEFLKLIQEKIRRGQMRYKDLNSKFDFQNAIGSIR